MFFLFLGNANIEFNAKSPIQRLYIFVLALLATWRIKHMNKKKFSTATLDWNFETFIIYVTALEALKMTIDRSRTF